MTFRCISTLMSWEAVLIHYDTISLRNIFLKIYKQLHCPITWKLFSYFKCYHKLSVNGSWYHDIRMWMYFTRPQCKEQQIFQFLFHILITNSLNIMIDKNNAEVATNNRNDIYLDLKNLFLLQFSILIEKWC